MFLELDVVNVFVYGTLKPGEFNYQRYCTGKVMRAKRAIALGQLYALPFGYPAMTLGEGKVQGYLLTFSDKILSQLDWLEGYDPHRPAAENEYNRQQVETYDLSLVSLGTAWVYLMSPEQVHTWGGILIPDAWWSSCVSYSADSSQQDKAN